MVYRQPETVTFHNARIIFKNFEGQERDYNQAGARNFSILLDERQAKDLEASGWNVKPLKRREEDDEQNYHLPVAVSFKNKPPRVFLVTDVDPETGRGRKKTRLSEELVLILDKVDAANVDLSISAYNWEMRGQRGKKAYLEAIFYTMYESKLEQEYADVEEISAQEEQMALESAEVSTHYDLEGEVVD